MSVRIVATAAFLAAIGAPAFAAAPVYHATLAAPGAAAVVVRDLRWQCEGTSCWAPFTATASDSTVCAAVVRKLGAITAFTAGARDLAAAEIDRCNAAKH